MNTVRQVARGFAGMVALAAATACTTGLGNVLGGVLGGTTSAQGVVQGIDTRNQVITVQQSNGQTIGVQYDNNTQVVYGNQNYPVTALRYGDQVALQVQQTNNGGYYAQSLQVLSSSSANNYPNGYPNGTSPSRYPNGGYPGTTGSVQQFVGQVQQLNQANGWFTLNSNGQVFTVVMPYNPVATDQRRFQNLRVGEYVSIYGMFLNNSQIQLTQFR